jgi:hypothetical protein
MMSTCSVSAPAYITKTALSSEQLPRAEVAQTSTMRFASAARIPKSADNSEGEMMMEGFAALAVLVSAAAGVDDIVR